MFVKPRPGYVVRDPLRERSWQLPAEGAEVPDNSVYWQRRVRDGDVEQIAGPGEGSNGNG
jgi:hypothetical protein